MENWFGTNSDKFDLILGAKFEAWLDWLEDVWGCMIWILIEGIMQ